MDILTYILAQNLARTAVSGVKSMRVDGTNLIITTNDDNELTINFPIPADGVSVTNVEIQQIDDVPHFIFQMSDNTTIDGGEVPPAPLAWRRLE